jgi:hypothetical protein
MARNSFQNFALTNFLQAILRLASLQSIFDAAATCIVFEFRKRLQEHLFQSLTIKLLCKNFKLELLMRGLRNRPIYVQFDHKRRLMCLVLKIGSSIYKTMLTLKSAKS